MKEYESSKKFLQQYWKELEKAADVIREKYYKFYSDDTEIGEFDFSRDTVEVKCERRADCGCCTPDEWNIELPVDIVTPEGLEKYMREKDEKIEKRRKAKAQRDRREKKEKEEASQKAKKIAV